MAEGRLEIEVMDLEDAEDRNTDLSDRKIIGYFSVNDNETYCADGRQLKYVYYQVDTGEMKVSFNLNHMFDSAVKKASDKYTTWNKLNNMFIWLSLNGPRISVADQIAFLTFRGNLTKIMCSPYEVNDDWTICARLCNGLIYLNSFDTENDVRKREGVSAHQLKCERWGFKFEQYMLTDVPDQKPNVDRVLNENAEFCCVFDRYLGDHRLIFGAEMDGIFSSEMLQLVKDKDDITGLEFVELKTCKILHGYNREKTFRRFKMLKWWCQSYLTDVQTVICGFRDDSGTVKLLRRYQTDDLPILAKGMWDKAVCLNFCARFLDFVKLVVLENSANDDVWKFDMTPQQTVCATKVTDSSSVYKTGFRVIKLEST